MPILKLRPRSYYHGESSCYIELTERNFRRFLKYKLDERHFLGYRYAQHWNEKLPGESYSLEVYEDVMNELSNVLPKYYRLCYRLKCWCDSACVHNEEETVLLTRSRYKHFKSVYELKITVPEADGRLWKLSGIEKLHSSYPAKEHTFSLFEQRIIGLLNNPMARL